MHNVTINGRSFKVCDNTLLSDLLIESGVATEHPCGGKGVCKKCAVSVNDKEELSCQYRIKSDITVKVDDISPVISEKSELSCENATENLCFCLDIGTTTLALALVSLNSKKIIDIKTAVNPQRTFGADVISRIEYCKNSQGLEKLQKWVIKEINALIDSFNMKNIPVMYVSGNTIMLHIFTGTSPLSMGVSPYTPLFLEEKEFSGESLKITGTEKIVTLPSIHAFVGADIVAGLNFLPKPEKGKHNLLVDLGTNAEIAVYGNGKVICTSAAAGPCFEGGNISCGMSALNGAIHKCNSFGKTETIGNCTAKGICGTGLIDIIAYLLKNSYIDKTGYMENEKYEISENVFIRQKDVRQYQLAKSAVFSGIIALLNAENLTYSDIENVYLSGGFSNEINIENAVFTKLFPEELKEKCQTIGNSSLLGTVKFATNADSLSDFTKNGQYIDLSLNPDFTDLFMENIDF